MGYVKPRGDGLATALLESDVQSLYYHNVFVVHRDRAGEEGDLATRRTLPAKVCYSMVSSTPKICVILPNPDKQENYRSPISIPVLHVYWGGPRHFVDMEHGIHCVVLDILFMDKGKECEVRVSCFHQRHPDIFQLWPGMSLVAIPVSYVELMQIPRPSG